MSQTLGAKSILQVLAPFGAGLVGFFLGIMLKNWALAFLFLVLFGGAAWATLTLIVGTSAKQEEHPKEMDEAIALEAQRNVRTRQIVRREVSPQNSIPPKNPTNTDSTDRLRSNVEEGEVFQNKEDLLRSFGKESDVLQEETPSVLGGYTLRSPSQVEDRVSHQEALRQAGIVVSTKPMASVPKAKQEEPSILESPESSDKEPAQAEMDEVEASDEKETNPVSQNLVEAEGNEGDAGDAGDLESVEEPESESPEARFRSAFVRSAVSSESFGEESAQRSLERVVVRTSAKERVFTPASHVLTEVRKAEASSVGLQQPAEGDASNSKGASEPAPVAVGAFTDPLLGQTIKEYELIECLGVGAFASVYRVEHRRLKKSFAMKILHSHIAVQERLVKRFQREARSLSEVEHPNVVEILDFDSDPNFGFFILMECVQGIPLSDYLKQHDHLTVKEALWVFDQVLAALATAHSKGITHRDLKPGNIMIEEKETFGEGRQLNVKVLDFSLATFEGEEESLTMTGAVLGSPKYMAPEQARGLGEGVDNRSDLYSCGILLGKCLTGRDIFSGASSTQILMQQISKEPPTLCELREDLNFSYDLERVFRKAVSKDPEARYQSASEMFAALEVAVLG